LSELLAKIEAMTEEELLDHISHLRLTVDFPFFASRLLKVQTMKGKIVPLELNYPQQLLHTIIEDHIRPKRLVRIVDLKSRRMGHSTYFSGLFYQKASRIHNRYAVQITHEPEATDTLFKMVKRFFSFSPTSERPETLYNNTKLLEFNNKDGRGLNSGFRVATAGKEDFGSGQTIHYAHLSETAKWDQGTTKSLLTSLLQTVPDEDDTMVVFESTAKGIGGEFYDRFWGARFRVWIKRLDADGKPVIEDTINATADLDNIYTSLFFPWFVFPDYVITPPYDFVLTPKEAGIKAQYGLSDAQIYWRRRTIANKCDANEDIFNQEYPATPEHAFLGSGRPCFDNAKLLLQKDAAPPPIARYECLTSTGKWLIKNDGRLSVWEEPRVGDAYIISADVAEGLEKGDFSTADVINHRTGDQVAQWHGHIDPDEFASILSSLGIRYNVALLAPERNNHGLMVVNKLMYTHNYPRIHCEMVPDPPGKPRKRFGWVTDKKTRPFIIDNMIAEVREGSHGIRCAATFEEMMAFKIQNNGRMEADSGRFDDRVISICIAKHLRQVLPVPRQILRNKRPSGATGGTKSKPNAKGWT